MEFLLYLFAGAAAGALSGLFGVGGGIIIVPILVLLFTQDGFAPAHIMHIALGTSLATIIFTSLSSARSHHKRGNVDWPIFRQMAPLVVVGTLLGSLLAAYMNSQLLKLIFSLFMLGVALQLLISPNGKTASGNTNNDQAKAPQQLAANTRPLINRIAGLLIGVASSLVGIGGGTITVPYLMYCGEQVRRAIGTSAAIGLPIAVAGTVGFVFNGLAATKDSHAVLPAMSLGFIYLPAFAGIALASMLTAPLGTRLAQRLPVISLKRLFALLLIAVGGKMLWSIVSG